MKKTIKGGMIISSAIALFLAGATTVSAEVPLSDNLSINGEAFADFGSTDVVQNKKNTIKHTGGNINRATLGVNYKLDNMWEAGILLESRVSNTWQRQNVVNLKRAFIKGDLTEDGAAVLTLGKMASPWVEYEEALWGHRYASMTETEQLGYEDATVLGVGLSGLLMDNRISYDVQVVNGGEFGRYRTSREVDFTSRVGFIPVQGLTLDVGYRTGVRGMKTDTNPNAQKQRLFQGMATYGQSGFRVGVNYIDNRDRTNSIALRGSHSAFSSYNQNTNILSGPIIQTNVKSKLIGGWVWADFGNKIGAFGRFSQEITKPYAGLTGVQVEQKIQHYIAGLEFTPMANLTFAAVYDKSTMDNNNYANNSNWKSSKAALLTRFSF